MSCQRAVKYLNRVVLEMENRLRYVTAISCKDRTVIGFTRTGFVEAAHRLSGLCERTDDLNLLSGCQVSDSSLILDNLDGTRSGQRLDARMVNG